MIKIFHDIKPKLDFGKIVKTLKIQPGSPEFDEFSDLFHRSAAVAAPKALLAKVMITARTDDSISAGGEIFHSHILSRKTAGSDHILFFAVTCGRELDRIPVAKDDFLAVYWLDVIKEQ